MLADVQCAPSDLTGQKWTVLLAAATAQKACRRTRSRRPTSCAVPPSGFRRQRRHRL